jgi:hypothetical protein
MVIYFIPRKDNSVYVIINQPSLGRRAELGVETYG